MLRAERAAVCQYGISGEQHACLVVAMGAQQRVVEIARVRAVDEPAASQLGEVETHVLDIATLR